jgi:hypothetical protein
VHEGAELEDLSWRAEVALLETAAACQSKRRVLANDILRFILFKG